MTRIYGENEMERGGVSVAHGDKITERGTGQEAGRQRVKSLVRFKGKSRSVEVTLTNVRKGGAIRGRGRENGRAEEACL
jgi:hypothetical protein